MEITKSDKKPFVSTRQLAISTYFRPSDKYGTTTGHSICLKKFGIAVILVSASAVFGYYNSGRISLLLSPMVSVNVCVKNICPINAQENKYDFVNSATRYVIMQYHATGKCSGIP